MSVPTKPAAGFHLPELVSETATRGQGRGWPSLALALRGTLLARAHGAKQTPGMRDFRGQSHLERDAAAGRALDEQPQILPRSGKITLGVRELAEHELAVALATRGVREALAQRGEIGRASPAARRASATCAR